MGNQFQIDITARDKYTRVFTDLNRKAARATQGISAATRAASRGGVAELANGVGVVARLMPRITSGSMAFARSFGAIEERTAGLFGVGDLLSGRLRMLASVVGLASGVAAKAGLDFGKLGFDNATAARGIGMSPTTLEAWQVAQKKAGGDPAAMTSALQSLGERLHASRWGEDQQLLDLLHVLKIPAPQQGRPLDVSGTMQALADRMSTVTDPHTRARIAALAGVQGAMPLLQRGGDETLRLRQAARREGLATEREIKEAERQREAIDGAMTALSAQWRKLGAKVAPTITDAAGFVGDVAGRSHGGQRRVSGVVTDEQGRPIAGKDWRDPAQRARDDESARILREEISAERDPGVRAALQRELARRENPTVTIKVDVTDSPGARTKVTATSNSASAPVRVNRLLAD